MQKCQIRRQPRTEESPYDTHHVHFEVLHTLLWIQLSFSNCRAYSICSTDALLHRVNYRSKLVSHHSTIFCKIHEVTQTYSNVHLHHQLVP